MKGLLNNKHLRAMLQEVNIAQNHSKAIEAAMQVPIFTEFVEDCMKIVEPDDVDRMQDELYKDISLSWRSFHAIVIRHLF